MLYRVDGDVIYVVDIWDVRKEPPTLTQWDFSINFAGHKR